jgi:hypothetical protein
MDAKIRRNVTIKEIIYLLHRVSNNLFALFGDTLWFICFIIIVVSIFSGKILPILNELDLNFSLLGSFL